MESESEAESAERYATLRAAYERCDHSAVLEIAPRVLSRFRDDVEFLEVVGFSANATGAWRTAVRYWLRLAEVRPSRVGPFSQATSAWLQLGKPREALRIVDRLLAKHPKDIGAIVTKLEILSELEEGETAESLLEPLDPSLFDATRYGPVIRIGRFHVARNELAKAVPWYVRATELDPAKPDAWVYLGRVLYRLGELERAESTWRHVLEIGTAHVSEAAVFLGRIALRNDRFEDAKQWFTRVIEQDPGHEESYRSLIQALQRERSDEALAELESVVSRYAEQFPDTPAPSVLLSRAYAARGQGDRALEVLHTCIDRFPDSLEAVRACARLEEQEGRLQDALERWNTAVGLTDRAEPLLESGRLMQLLELPAEVVLSCIQQAVDREPEESTPAYRMGQALVRVGRRAEAATWFETARQFAPRDTNVTSALIALLLTFDEHERIRHLLDEAVTRFDAEKAVDCLALARLHKAANDLDGAVRWAERAVELEPDNASATAAAGELEFRRGFLEIARGNLRVARDLDPENRAVAGLLARTLVGLEFLSRSSGRESGSDRAPRVPEDLIPIVMDLADDASAEPSSVDRICVVTRTLGPGGSERQVAYTMAGLRQVQGHEFVPELVAVDLDPVHRRDFFLNTVVETGWGIADLSERDGHQSLRDLVAARPQLRDHARLIAAFPDEMRDEIGRLYAHFREVRPRLVHLWQDTTNVCGAIAGLLAGVPCILMAGRSLRPDTYRRYRRYFESVYRELLRSPRVRMCNNSAAGAGDYEDWLGLTSGTVRVIHNGFDIEGIRQRAAEAEAGDVRRSLGFPEDSLVLGGVMRFSEEKRPELWVAIAFELASSNPDARFVLVGDGPMRPGLIEEIADRGLSDRIVLPGAVRPVEPWIAAMDMLLLTSRVEGLPNVLLEAQALGVPVATTRVGGAPEALVDGATGVAVDSSDARVLAARIDEAWSDSQWMARARIEAARFAEERFSIEAMTRRTIEEYRESCDRVASGGEARPDGTHGRRTPGLLGSLGAVLRRGFDRRPP